MGRKTFDRSTSGAGSLIDMRTKKPVEKPSLPVICNSIRYYRERMGMGQKALAEQIGISGNAVSNWEAGRSRPDVNILPEICKALHITLYELYDIKDMTIRYTAREQLLIDHFQMLSDGHKCAVESMTDILLRIEESERCPAIRQLINCERALAAGIGDPTEFDDKGEPIFLYASSEVDRADYVFTVNGDSMEPEYHNRDRVLVQRGPDGPELTYGEAGAFIIGNETYIKVYEEDGLHSLNPNYKTLRFCDEESVYLIGRVVGKIDETDIAAQEDVEKYISLHPDEFEKKLPQSRRL